MALIAVLAWRPALLADVRNWGRGVQVVDCDVTNGPCEVVLADGTRLWASVTPRDIAPERPITWEVRGPVPERVSLSGVEMNMGVVEVPFTASGDGYVAEAMLPACTLGTMHWTADILLASGATARFRFVSREGAETHAWDEVDAAATPTWPPFSALTPSGNAPSSAAPGEVVLVYFGYLGCPDICPTMLASLGRGVSALSPADQARVRGVFVTLDPERDAPDNLAKYAASFHPRFAGGTLAEGAQVAAAWGIASRKVEMPGSAMGYSVDHGTSAFLVAPGAKVQVIPHGSSPDQVATALRGALETVAP